MTLQPNGDVHGNGSSEHTRDECSAGCPVQIVTPVVNPCEHTNEADCTPSCRETHFQLNEKALEAILSRDNVKGKKVCVLSIVGAFRKGKSFLLDFFLRYLQIQNESWLSDNSERVTGFKWRGGSEKETEGIWMWSEPFFVKAKVHESQDSECKVNAHSNGAHDHSAQTAVNATASQKAVNGSLSGDEVDSEEEICVLLMDVQGTFDSSSTIRACATIFALTAMLSSVQIYNVSHNIQEDDLQHLQVFTEYGRVALAEDADAKPFQNLVVLVRDWSYPYEAQYGFEGGSTILDRRLAITDRQHAELQQLRRYVRECFASLRCFLMPHPGLQVATSPHFDGSLSQIGAEFRDGLAQFVPALVGPQSVGAHTKRVGHQAILAGELLTYFRTYISIFQTEELPQPKTMYEATAEANNQAAAMLALDLYRQKMDSICGSGRPFIAADTLTAQHAEARDSALRTFHERRKMGGPQFSQRYEARLSEDIEALRSDYEKANESKSLFRVARTPLTLLVIILCNNLLDSVIEFIGLVSIDALLDSFGWLLMSAVAIWSYAKYAGRFSEIAMMIDNFAAVIYEHMQAALSSNTTIAAMRVFNDQLQDAAPTLRQRTSVQVSDRSSTYRNSSGSFTSASNPQKRDLADTGAFKSGSKKEQ